MRERRYKIARIDEDKLIALFNMRLHLPRYFQIEHGNELPSDAVVVSAWLNPHCKAIEFVLYHDSFDIVASGCMIPHFNGESRISVAVDPIGERVREYIRELEGIGETNWRDWLEFKSDVIESLQTIIAGRSTEGET